MNLNKVLIQRFGAALGVAAGAVILLQLVPLPWISQYNAPFALTAVALGLFGNLLRAARTKVLLDFGRPGKLSRQFLALNAGVLLNSAFPFRIGELARAFLLARQLRISLMYTFVAVVLERLIDVIIIVGAFVATTAATTNTYPIEVTQYAAFALVVAILALGIIALLVLQNNLLLKTLWGFSRLWNPKLSMRLKLSFWSLVHGIQSFLHTPNALLKYLVFTIVAWATFIGAVVFAALSAGVEISGVGIVVPFLAPDGVTGSTTLSGRVETLTNALDVALQIPAAQLVSYAVFLWVTLNLPEAAIGLVALLTRPVYQQDNSHARNSPLDRSKPWSSGMGEFLDSFYRRDDIARILHDISLQGEVRVLAFFKGGSDALTALVERNSEKMIRKVVLRKHEAKLSLQYRWLQKHEGLNFVASAISEGRTETSYFVDIKYESAAVPLFDYIHTEGIESSRAMINQIWDSMFTYVYGNLELAESQAIVEQYVQDRLIDRLNYAASADLVIASIWKANQVVVNGQVFPGLPETINRVLTSSAAMEDLGVFLRAEVAHGDLTVDNVLVDTDGDFILIDPSDDNQIQGPIIDVARMQQSLQGGYEFINSLKPGDVQVTVEAGSASIEYPAFRSAIYETLALEVNRISQTRLSVEEQNSLDFHIGLLFGRMMSHRVHIEPTTAAAYFGQCVVFMNKFLDRYEEPQTD